MCVCVCVCAVNVLSVEYQTVRHAVYSCTELLKLFIHLLTYIVPFYLLTYLLTTN